MTCNNQYPVVHQEDCKSETRRVASGRSLMRLAILLLLFSFVGTGCTTGYWVDRGRDAADVFTLGVGVGLGAKARVGPIVTGLLLDVPLAALRGGTFSTNAQVSDIGIPQSFDLQGVVTGVESFSGGNPARGKKFGAECSDHPFIPFLQTPNNIVGRRWESEPPYFYTQLEVVLAVGPSFRFGCNPGEFVDLILGFVGIDIFNDDLSRRANHEP